MAGLMAARALSDFYETVTLVERDLLSEEFIPRQGVPQGRHVHGLLTAGSDAMERFFPGLSGELVQSGATVLDEGNLSRGSFNYGGCELNRRGQFKDPRSVLWYIGTRPFLEGHVRRRVRAIENLEFLDNHDVVGYLEEDSKRVTGVRIVNRVSGAEHALHGDLTVDAMGRAARTPAFLEQLGYGRPKEERVAVRVTYTSQLVRVPAGTVDEKVAFIGPTPQRPYGASFFRCENDTLLLTLAGLAGHHAPTDRDEMISWAEPFASPPIMAALRTGEAMSDVVSYRYPASQWRRYDKMRRFPDGLLVIGDAICSFNPLYAQGMTIASLEAAALHECLLSGDRGLSKRFFRAAAKLIKTSWMMGKLADLAIPDVEGSGGLMVQLANRYVDLLLAAGAADIAVAEQFLRVANMIDSPARLIRPSMVYRAVAHSRPKYQGAERGLAAFSQSQ
jgi:2-polyprenyl-6-methoxyphenol hydroxylase-like FAD-dependent oxidoreductase